MSDRRASRRLSTLITALLAATALLAGGAGAAQAATPGIHLHLLWSNVDGAEAARQLDQAAAAGAGYARVDAGWSSLEHDGKGQWNAWHLKRLDAVVAMAEARDIKLLLMFADAPCWASSAPESLKQGCSGKWWERGVQRYLPTRPADYGDALAYLARRYGTRVAAWEMWNEPNHETFNPGPDKARRYAALVRAAYPKAKAAAPGVKFLAGALSTADFKFTEELFANGMGSSFDAFSVHPYANDKSPLDPGSDDWVNTSFVRGIPAVRRALVRRGIYKPIWLTEFGWSTTRVRDAAPYRNGVDADVQARYIGQALAQARKWSYVPVAIYYNLRDRAVDSTSRTDHFGLTRVDGTPKPALAAFRAAATGASASRKARRARAARRRARAARAAHRTVR